MNGGVSAERKELLLDYVRRRRGDVIDPEHHGIGLLGDDSDPGRIDTGFISKVATNGEIQDLHWVTGLDGPCGMGIHGDRLFVVEGVRGNLVEIEIESGRIVGRHPMPDHRFLNDLAIDASGTIYMSNTSLAPQATDIYKFRVRNIGKNVH